MSIKAKHSLFAVSQTEVCRTVCRSQSHPYREDFQAMSKASNYALSLRGHLWPWQSVSLKPSVLYQIPIYSKHFGNGFHPQGVRRICSAPSSLTAAQPRRAYALLGMTWLIGSLFLY